MISSPTLTAPLPPYKVNCMKKVPIETLSLFPDLNESLAELLKSLTPEEWHAPTLFPSWTVKDVAAHLLDTSIRRLSQQRDGFVIPGGPEGNSYSDLAAFITSLADTWTEAFQRVSPQILVEMIIHFQNELSSFLNTQDPESQALHGVSWAGEESSDNWFDFAREYTERWLHQMHIVEAVGRPTVLLERRFYHPLLETFMNALPHHYRHYDPAPGTLYRFGVAGKAGGTWIIRKEEHSWVFDNEADHAETHGDAVSHMEAEVILPEQTAWKILTKGMERSEALAELQWSGDESVARHLLSMTCVTA